MIEMISLRSFRLATTKGHIIEFEARVPRPVPDIIVQDAMAAGCVPANPDDQQFIDDQSISRVEFVGNMRRSILYLAMDVLARENNVKNFDGGGKPKGDVLAKRLGFDVPAKERTAVWQEYLNSKSSGTDPALHPQAEQVMSVLAAEDLDELRQLALEAGISSESAANMTTRDLRKAMLAKYSGIAAG